MRTGVGGMVLIRVPQRICDRPVFPPQALGVLGRSLRTQGIEVRSYDIRELLGVRGARRLRAAIYADTGRARECVVAGSGALDDHFSGVRGRIDPGSAAVALLSQEYTGVEASLVTLLLAGFIKRANPEAVVVVGEGWEQLDYVSTLLRAGAAPQVDIVVRRHGIESLPRILAALGGGEDLSGIPDILYRDPATRQPVETPARDRPQHLDLLDYGTLDLEQYRLRLARFLPARLLSRPDETLLLLPFTFLSGCPHACAFCANSVNTRLERLEPREVVASLREMVSRYRTRYFMFLNHTLNVSRAYLEELCDRLTEARLGIVWSDCANAGNLDRALLAKMRAAGAAKLYFGLETGSDRLLRLCQKGLTTADVARCLRWSHEAGIWNGVEIIAGLPHEREEDVGATIAFLRDHQEHIDEMSVNPFLLHRGSRFLQDPSAFGLENVRDDGVDLFGRLERRGDLVLDSASYRYRFDEAGGLPWEKKRRQIARSYARIVSRSPVREHFGPTSEFDLPILLYLHGRCGGTRRLREVYRAYQRRSALTLLFNRDALAYLFSYRQLRLGALKFLRRL